MDRIRKLLARSERAELPETLEEIERMWEGAELTRNRWGHPIYAAWLGLAIDHSTGLFVNIDHESTGKPYIAVPITDTTPDNVLKTAFRSYATVQGTANQEKLKEHATGEGMINIVMAYLNKQHLEPGAEEHALRKWFRNELSVQHQEGYGDFFTGYQEDQNEGEGFGSTGCVTIKISRNIDGGQIPPYVLAGMVDGSLPHLRLTPCSSDDYVCAAEAILLSPET